MISVELNEDGTPKSAIKIDEVVEAQLHAMFEDSLSNIEAMKKAYRCGWAQCGAKARKKASEQGALIGETEHGDKVYAVGSWMTRERMAPKAVADLPNCAHCGHAASMHKENGCYVGPGVERTVRDDMRVPLRAIVSAVGELLATGIDFEQDGVAELRLHGLMHDYIVTRAKFSGVRWKEVAATPLSSEWAAALLAAESASPTPSAAECLGCCLRDDDIGRLRSEVARLSSPSCAECGGGPTVANYCAICNDVIGKLCDAEEKRAGLSSRAETGLQAAIDAFNAPDAVQAVERLLAKRRNETIEECKQLFVRNASYDGATVIERIRLLATPFTRVEDNDKKGKET